jgi:hypothetical protein
MNVWTSYTVGYFWTGWALASFYEGLRRDEAFTTVSFHPSVYKTDIPSSAFVPFHWTVPSYRLPWSRSVAVLFINDRQSSIQSKPFHTLHNSFFFCKRVSMDQIYIRYIFQKSVPFWMPSFDFSLRKPEFDPRVMQVRCMEDKVTLGEGLILCFPLSVIIPQVWHINIRCIRPIVLSELCG